MTSDLIRDARSKLSGLHFAKEALRPHELETLLLSEKLLTALEETVAELADLKRTPRHSAGSPDEPQTMPATAAGRDHPIVELAKLHLGVPRPTKWFTLDLTDPSHVDAVQYAKNVIESGHPRDAGDAS